MDIPPPQAWISLLYLSPQPLELNLSKMQWIESPLLFSPYTPKSAPPRYSLPWRKASPPDLASTCHKRPGITAFKILWFSHCPLCPLSCPCLGPQRTLNLQGQHVCTFCLNSLLKISCFPLPTASALIVCIFDVHSLAWAAISKYHRLLYKPRWLYKKHLFLTVWRHLMKPSLLIATFLLYPHIWRDCLSHISSYKGTNLIHYGSTLMP